MKLLLSSFFALSLFTVYGQTTQPFQHTPYFSAVVVKDITKSVNWYKSLFGLQMKQEMNDPNGSYKIAILESPVYLLELLQLKGSIERAPLLEGKPQTVQIEGHFKIGFKTTDMNACIKQLNSLKAEIEHDWKDEKTGKRNIIVKDPDGNLIQFFE
jgi:uncharacterized glyoxalase superfamily protein PhnB